MRVFLALILLTTPAYAHDHWINHAQLRDPISRVHCCTPGHDCPVIPHGGIREVISGYWIAETYETIPHIRVIWESPDGRWYRCPYLGQNGKGQTKCLIGPPNSM